MSKVACIYFEGNDSKVALFQQENYKVKLLKAESIDTSLAFSEKQTVTANKSNGSNKQKDLYQYNYISEESATYNRTFLQKLSEFFIGEDLSKCKFIPILTEPAVYFQKVSDEKDLASLNITPNGKIESAVNFVKLNDDSKLAVYPSGQSNYLEAIDSLARMNKRKFIKIPTVKCAEISLASYIAKKKEFNKKDTSLILYVGKEYSKMIFLRGKTLFHVGSTLSVGKNSFNAHSVIVSKILLELEHGLLSNIENIIICGEDDSGDLIYTISEAYPAAKVSFQKIEQVDIQGIDSFSNESSFIIPTAVAEEYFAEINKEFFGINLLPNYIKEEQKLIHLDWKGYIMILLIILSMSFFFMKINSNSAELEAKNQEIRKIQIIQVQNKETVAKVQSYKNKILNFDKTKVILDQLSIGKEILSSQMKKLSDYTNQKRDIWLSRMNLDASKNLKIDGYTLSRPLVKELSDSYNGSTLQNILYEPLKNSRTFKFSINAGIVLGDINYEAKK